MPSLLALTVMAPQGSDECQVLVRGYVALEDPVAQVVAENVELSAVAVAVAVAVPSETQRPARHPVLRQHGQGRQSDADRGAPSAQCFDLLEFFRGRPCQHDIDFRRDAPSPVVQAYVRLGHTLGVQAKSLSRGGAEDLGKTTERRQPLVLRAVRKYRHLFRFPVGHVPACAIYPGAPATLTVLHFDGMPEGGRDVPTKDGNGTIRRRRPRQPRCRQPDRPKQWTPRCAVLHIL
jgi:hypothetical protein